MKLVFLIIFTLVVFTLKADNSEFNAYTGLDDVEVREKPSQNSKILGKLKIGFKLQITNSSNEEVVNGYKGKWVYVKKIQGIYYEQNVEQGWIFDKNISYLKNFQKGSNCKYKDLKKNAEGSEYYVHFEFLKDCKFIKYESEPIYDEKVGNYVGETKKAIVSKGYLFFNKLVVLAIEEKDSQVVGIFFKPLNGNLNFHYLK